MTRTPFPAQRGGSSPPIACRSLVKAYGDQRAVDDLSFSVPGGTITGFVGANGAGKTTTMRMLVGLVAPTAGDALVHGQRYQDLADPRRKVGVVLDGPGANPRHRARTHLDVLATSVGLPRRRVSEVLEQVQLSEYDHQRVGTFSLGMRQRLALAGALLGDPEVLLLDEPVNGLDPRGIVWMRDLLAGLAAGGRSILISSHLLSELSEVAHRVAIIDRGRLVTEAAVDELVDGRTLEEVYFDLAGSLGDPPANGEAAEAQGRAVAGNDDAAVTR